ncbi:hypothetical protein AB0945_07285 [Streptomyces sp. NPDC005474]|uniref:hypothetical protein n=1 Tax=Streptomyces sp. NPDC005474 TaxID=3154878 RepID=UPI003453B5C1
MAQTTTRIPGNAGYPDIFSARTHVVANAVLTVVLGLVYGYWAAAIRRDAGPITGWNVFFGVVSALAFMVVMTGVRAVAPRLRRELHALAWGAFAGVAFGFMYSQTGESVLRSSGNSLIVAGSVTAAMFYRYYTHEDAAGHRVS